MVLLPRRRQGDPARRTFEQLDSQPLLQQLHMPTDGGLGHVQGFRGLDVAAQPGGGIKGTHRVEWRQTVIRNSCRRPWLLNYLTAAMLKLKFRSRNRSLIIDPTAQ